MFFKKKQKVASVSALSDEAVGQDEVPGYERPSDASIMAYQKELSDATAASQPLVSSLRSIATLFDEYNQADVRFQLKINDLQEKKYTTYRTCRGDGNCWFRAIGNHLALWHLTRYD